jgi:hypothetical protein
MFLRLTTPSSREQAWQKIRVLLHEHAEWFCTHDQDNTQLLRRTEIDLSLTEQKLVLSCWTERGIRSWRILEWQWTGERLLFKASRRMGAERPLIELVPRASASAIAATIRAARQIRCYQLASLASSMQPELRIERCALSPGIRRGQPGRYARILLRRKAERIAVTGSVAIESAAAVDAFLSAALLWFKRTSDRIKPPYIRQLWLIVPSQMIRALSYRVVLLRKSLQDVVRVFEVDSSLTSLRMITTLERSQIWKRKLARFPPVQPATVSEQTLSIIARAPEAIDVVHARHGETLRYFGLPFARVRSLLDTEAVWFGVSGSSRRRLDQTNTVEWENLLKDLREHRSADASDHRNALYITAAEAWLESLLRKDITKLDPGLIIAPLHAQFRTSHGGRLGVRPIDLLALRRDGRLVVIELKVSEDREHVLQGADYWRRVEAHRRRGHIAAAKLFDDLPISNQPPLVYLVAPTLRVHPSFATLAKLIADDIEIYRFDINENWRSGVQVMRRLRVN